MTNKKDGRVYFRPMKCSKCGEQVFLAPGTTAIEAAEYVKHAECTKCLKKRLEKETTEQLENLFRV